MATSMIGRKRAGSRHLEKGKISREITSFQKIIIDLAQSTLSQSSIAFIRAEALTLQSLSIVKRERIQFMLQNENVYRSDGTTANEPPKNRSLLPDPSP